MTDCTLLFFIAAHSLDDVAGIPQVYDHKITLYKLAKLPQAELKLLLVVDRLTERLFAVIWRYAQVSVPALFEV
ncbi:hypothetical protein [Synechococcus sp. MIT S9509]|uniref:hypothetical protein n=1 Tax=Synechococcus sp. MIT S9509 TaxID=1801630 RepID=UPI0012E70D0D|nr:hypothetical protein [Synechococcus sp. MIT S9509]